MTIRYLIRYILWSVFLLMTAYALQGCTGNSIVETPSIPANLSAVQSTSETSLSWSASTDNAGVVGYKIYRDGQYLESVTTTEALDSEPTGSAQHCYSVSAYDADANESAQSAPICTTGPSTPVSGQCSVFPETATGLAGVVSRGPIQPVCTIDQPCDAPFSAGFRLTQGDVTVASFRSDSDGCFAVRVPAGDYVVVPDADAPIFPLSQTKTVTVGPDGWTQVQLSFDTSIR